MNFSPTKIFFRNLILLLIAIVIVLITWQMRSVQSAAGSSSSKNKYLDLIYEKRDPDILIEAYHSDINDLFNEKIKKMVEVMKKNEKDPNKITNLFKPPEYNKENEIPTTRKTCTPENLSTYCVSLEAVKVYFDFRDALSEASKIENAKAGEVYAKLQSGGATKGDLKDAGSNLTNYAKNLEKIELEAELSRQSLDQALAVYNEMQFALPMHTKYMDIVKSLEKYRDKVSSLRKQIEKFPGTFLDVTTTQCT